MQEGPMQTQPSGDAVTQLIIRCILRVYHTLGPGFLEHIYKRALIIELRKQNLIADVERDVIVYYDGQEVGRHRLDLLVQGQVIIELKAVEAFHRAHYAQLRSYLTATGLDVGLLVNFADNRADFRRVERTRTSPRPQASPRSPKS